MTARLHRQHEEADLIAHPREDQPSASFCYEDHIDSLDRARVIVHHVDVHEQMLRALEAGDIMPCEDDLR